MKKLIFGGVLLVLVGIGNIGCEKEVVADTVLAKTQNESEIIEKAAEPVINIGVFTVQIDRPEGKKTKKDKIVGAACVLVFVNLSGSLLFPTLGQMINHHQQ